MGRIILHCGVAVLCIIASLAASLASLARFQGIPPLPAVATKKISGLSWCLLEDRVSPGREPCCREVTSWIRPPFSWWLTFLVDFFCSQWHAFSWLPPRAPICLGWNQSALCSERSRIQAVSEVLNDYENLKGHNNLQKVQIVFLPFFIKENSSFWTEGRVLSPFGGEWICLAFSFSSLLSSRLPFQNSDLLLICLP